MALEQRIHIDSYERRSGVCPASMVFAQRGDIFISQEYQRISRPFLDYLAGIRNFNNIRVFPSIDEIELIIPQGEGRTTAQKLLRDQESLSSLKSRFNASKPYGLECFASASEIQRSDRSISEIAKVLGIPLLSGDYDVFLRYGGKSNSRKLFQSLGLQTPLGVEEVSEERIRKAWPSFSLLDRKGIWIKADWGAAEHRNVYVPTILPLISLHAFDELTKRYNGNYVLEEHITDAVSFPAVLIQIDTNVFIQDVHEQSSVGINTYYMPDSKDKDSLAKWPFAGPPDWWEDENTLTRQRFIQDANKIGQALKLLGWKGMVCIDSIVDKNGNIYWNEINFRKGGSSFIVEALRRIVDIHPEEILEDRGVIFVTEHFFTPSVDFQSLLNAISDLLYDPYKREGLVIVNGEYYDSAGFDLVAFSCDNCPKEQLRSLLQEAENRIK